jgi:hypothetical protein
VQAVLSGSALIASRRFVDRRIEPRMLCADVVEVRWRENGFDHHCTADLSDISQSGVCLQLEQPIPAFTTLQIRHTAGELTGTVRNCSWREAGYSWVWSSSKAVGGRRETFAPVA